MLSEVRESEQQRCIQLRAVLQQACYSRERLPLQRPISKYVPLVRGNPSEVREKVLACGCRRTLRLSRSKRQKPLCTRPGLAYPTWLLATIPSCAMRGTTGLAGRWWRPRAIFHENPFTRPPKRRPARLKRTGVKKMIRAAKPPVSTPGRLQLLFVPARALH